jgi:hypothetical protein
MDGNTDAANNNGSTDGRQLFRLGTADGRPAMARQISGTSLAASEDFSCPICLDLLSDPVTTECGHTFCRHCISTVFGQENTTFDESSQPTVSCPRCRTQIATHYEVNPKIVLGMQEKGMTMCRYTGTAASINGTDGNRTETDGRFDVRLDHDGFGLEADLGADVVWGGGTVHSTYRETTCRVRGIVSAGELSARAEYSNGPWEEWTGTLTAVGGVNGTPTKPGSSFELSNGKYVWHGWNGRTTTGKLELSLAPSKAHALWVAQQQQQLQEDE